MKKLFFISLLMFVFSCSKDESIAEDRDVSDEETFTLWKGSILSFEKIDDSNSSIELNQDRITDNVWITKDNDII